MLERVRSKAFWIADAIRHKSVRRHYEDILSFRNGNMNSDERLRSILEYAIHNVPFYENISNVDIAFFPVMSKPVYKEQGNRCRSREYLEDDKLCIASTSGSTGTPLIIYQDADKKSRMRADLLLP